MPARDVNRNPQVKIMLVIWFKGRRNRIVSEHQREAISTSRSTTVETQQQQSEESSDS